MRLVERSLHACVNRWSNAAIIDITRKMTSATNMMEEMVVLCGQLDIVLSSL